MNERDKKRWREMKRERGIERGERDRERKEIDHGEIEIVSGCLSGPTELCYFNGPLFDIRRVV